MGFLCTCTRLEKDFALGVLGQSRSSHHIHFKFRDLEERRNLRHRQYFPDFVIDFSG